ncbi:MAG: hypothetical protein SV186_05225 [Candidatus Nanohaloarchaea archaeon]|nr:hypothetical protein [Candidatus Nanohaloarchaea archaeon]
MQNDDLKLYAEPVEDRAKRQADDLDNAFGSLLRGNNTDGIAVVLEQGDDELAYRTVDDEDAAVDAAEEIAADHGIELDDGLDYDRLLRE